MLTPKRSIRLTILLLSLQSFLGTAVSAQPASQFAELEDHLLDSEELSLAFQVVASGAVQASIEGTLRMASTGEVNLLAEGNFAGQDIDLFISNNGQTFNRTLPSALVEELNTYAIAVFGIGVHR